MVFLVEDFVNLPADQIANIWLAAHMKRKLHKKDIKKTKLGAACSQLHSDKTKKPMQLRHYGQCLIGISWIHYKQVEYLHNDCNESWNKARLVLVRKRNVDLDPSKSNARSGDITLLPNNANNANANDNNAHLDLMDIDLNANNLSQLYLDDHMSDDGSLLNDGTSNTDNLALDNEITMQQNELVSPDRTIRDRRSSFGNISSLLMGDMDIEIKFDDDDIAENNSQILEESQALRHNIEENIASLTDNDDMVSVERGRANEGSVNNFEENMSDIHSIGTGTGQGTEVSIKEISKLNLEPMDMDTMSVDTHGTQNGRIIPMENAMEIDDNMSQQSMGSIHVSFNDTMSVNEGSVATVAIGGMEQGTPEAKSKKVREKNESKKAKKVRKKKRKKARFVSDAKIELDRHELRASNMDREDFVYPCGRDAMHIWREFPLSTLDFDELWYQPLSKQLFGQLPSEISKEFKDCNKNTMAVSAENGSDELGNINILREESEVEQARDESDNLEDFGMNNLDIIEPSMNMSDGALLEMNDNRDNSAIEPDLDLMNDNASTLDSVCNDAIPAQKDALFDAEIINEQENVEPLQNNIEIEMAEEEDMDSVNHLSFETNDENILTQMSDNDGNGNERNVNGNGIKPKDWSRRARKTFTFFKKKEGKEFSFNELMQGQTERKTVAGVFYELLVFKNSDLMDLKQSEPYGDITITKTDNFHRHARLSQRLSQRV